MALNFAGATDITATDGMIFFLVLLLWMLLVFLVYLTGLFVG